MLLERQFSINYLLLETFWIALSIGLARFLAVNRHAEEISKDLEIWLMASLLALPIVIATAIGGVFGYMKTGASVGAWLAPIVWGYVLIPWVQS